MSKQFIKDAIRTESNQYHNMPPRIIHAVMGLSTESAEMLDALKKSMFYGKPLDTINLKEEAGDILWYLAILFDELGTDFETEMDRVIRKLKTRYPEKFTEECAINRDLNKEKKVLES